jgi:hypothetical protein
VKLTGKLRASQKMCNSLRKLVSSSANKQFAADGTGSVPLRLGHCATTEINRYVKKEID